MAIIFNCRNTDFLPFLFNFKFRLLPRNTIQINIYTCLQMDPYVDHFCFSQDKRFLLRPLYSTRVKVVIYSIYLRVFLNRHFLEFFIFAHLLLDAYLFPFWKYIMSRGKSEIIIKMSSLHMKVNYYSKLYFSFSKLYSRDYCTWWTNKIHWIVFLHLVCKFWW